MSFWTPYSARLRWLQHFSHVQQGALSSLAVLQQDAWVEAQASHASDPPIDLSVPVAALDIRRRMAKRRNGKAVGEDSLPGEL